MSVVMSVLLIAHLLCWAVVLGGNLATVRTGKVYAGSWHGAGGALATGIIMYVLLLTPLVPVEPNHLKLGVKTLVALAVVVLAFLAHKRNRQDLPTASLVAPIIALTALNVVVAVAWR